ncbi:MAG: recombination mediator RecR [Bacteroidia bacterium]|nr:recombination mediator RecR [Bacteroidia bacterium]
MNIDGFPSRLLENAVTEFAKLPGIGKKTALRLVLHLLKQNSEEVEQFGNSVIRLKQEIKHCQICNNISDDEICRICSDDRRDSSLVCVVENVKDIMAIESTRQYTGVYHVLGGIISPMDGIGPGDLNIEPLEQKLAGNRVKEIIFALSTTMEGDTTNFYLFRKFSRFDVRISAIARGVSIGDELEYTDEVTLGNSIMNRVPYEKTISSR